MLTLHADKELVSMQESESFTFDHFWLKEYLRSNKQLIADTFLIGLYNPGDLYEENSGEHRWQWHDGLLYTSSDDEIMYEQIEMCS